MTHISLFYSEALFLYSTAKHWFGRSRRSRSNSSKYADATSLYVSEHALSLSEISYYTTIHSGAYYTTIHSGAPTVTKPGRLLN